MKLNKVENFGRYISKTFSVRLSLMVLVVVAVLMAVSLYIMFYYSRKAIREEAIQHAEQTLDGTIQRIDNVLLSVEQSAGNMYWNLYSQLRKPEKMREYSRKLVETNPYILGCAFAFEPYYYKDRAYFMIYAHRTSSGGLAMSDSPIIQAETFGNKPYNEQIWYEEPMKTGRAHWINPMKNEDAEGEPIITFSLPFYNSEGKRVGVMGVDVSLDLLSKIVLASKPSPNSYCAMLGSDGSYIVHPDSTKLYHHTIFSQAKPDDDPSLLEAGKAMIAGEKGYRSFSEDGVGYYVFYKPFKLSSVPGRSMEDIEWSVGIVYPEEDIFGDYNRLLYYALLIAVLGLCLVYVLCWVYTHRQLLPLQMLTESVQRIAKGNFSEPIPDSRQQDEIGRLQDNFQQMQQSLGQHISELNQMTSTLEQRSENLRQAYQQAKEDDRMKVAFLHNMTNQMLVPANVIEQDVKALFDESQQKSAKMVSRLVQDIEYQGQNITELLNSMLKVSGEDKGKEGQV